MTIGPCDCGGCARCLHDQGEDCGDLYCPECIERREATCPSCGRVECSRTCNRYREDDDDERGVAFERDTSEYRVVDGALIMKGGGGDA